MVRADGRYRLHVGAGGIVYTIESYLSEITWEAVVYSRPVQHQWADDFRRADRHEPDSGGAVYPGADG